MNYVGKQLNSVNQHNIVLISLQAMFNMSSFQPKSYKIWLRFHKAISIYIKQMEMCSILSYPVEFHKTKAPGQRQQLGLLLNIQK